MVYGNNNIIYKYDNFDCNVKTMWHVFKQCDKIKQYDITKESSSIISDHN